jgi:hypothetical protein
MKILDILLQYLVQSYRACVVRSARTNDTMNFKGWSNRPSKYTSWPGVSVFEGSGIAVGSLINTLQITSARRYEDKLYTYSASMPSHAPFILVRSITSIKKSSSNMIVKLCRSTDAYLMKVTP